MKKKFKSLIVEDDALIVGQIESFLAQTMIFEPPLVATNCTEAVANMNEHEHSLDILFLDIELPDMNGVDFMRSFPNRCPTVVLSAHPQYAIECFDQDVADFLEKPLNYLRFLRSLRRTVLRGDTKILKEDVADRAFALGAETSSSVPASSKYIYLRKGHINQRFGYNDILYLEAANIYTKVITQDGTTTVSEPISALEERLMDHNFMRVHKSYAINLKHVTQYSAKSVWLEGKMVPLGRKYQSEVQARLKAIIG